MTTLKILVEDEQAELLKKLLNEISFIKGIVEESASAVDDKSSGSPLEQIRKIQQEIGDKKLFDEITDPENWQREVRKEWDDRKYASKSCPP